MRLDDLLGDRQAKPRLLTEALMGPVGVEALEDLLQRVGANTRPVVIDGNFDLALEPSCHDTHAATRRRERARVVDQVVDHLSKPRVVARHHESIASAALDRKSTRLNSSHLGISY